MNPRYRLAFLAGLGGLVAWMLMRPGGILAGAWKGWTNSVTDAFAPDAVGVVGGGASGGTTTTDENGDLVHVGASVNPSVVVHSDGTTEQAEAHPWDIFNLELNQVSGIPVDHRLTMWKRDDALAERLGMPALGPGMAYWDIWCWAREFDRHDEVPGIAVHYRGVPREYWPEDARDAMNYDWRRWDREARGYGRG